MCHRLLDLMLFDARRNLAEDEMIQTLIGVIGCLAPQNK
jgi:hypothetical protein